MLAIIHLVVIFSSALTHAQERSATFIAQDSIYDFTLRDQKLNRKPLHKKVYYSFENFQLFAQVGTRARNYLHGDFENRSYATNRLYAKGNFRHGLKHSQWRTWNADGKLNSIEYWKNGRLKKRILLDGSEIERKRKRISMRKRKAVIAPPEGQQKTSDNEYKKSRNRSSREDLKNGDVEKNR